MPTAFDAKIAVGSILRSTGISKVENGIEAQAVEGSPISAYKIPNVRVGCMLKNTHVPVMFWRSVGSSQNAFFVESYIDELAHAAGQDPYKFRRALLMHRPDLIGVLDKIAGEERLGQTAAGRPAAAASPSTNATARSSAKWRKSRSARRARSRSTAWWPRSIAAMSVNPRIVEAQIQSGVIYGLSAALYGEITIKDGAVEQKNFDDYDVVRLADAPKIEVYLALSGGKKWGGIGEPGTAPTAPALANAVFAATGTRVRSLP